MIAEPVEAHKGGIVPAFSAPLKNKRPCRLLGKASKPRSDPKSYCFGCAGAGLGAGLGVVAAPAGAFFTG